MTKEAQFGQHLFLHTFSFDPPDEFALETEDVESDADVIVVVKGRAVSRVSCCVDFGLGNPAGNWERDQRHVCESRPPTHAT